MRARVVVRVTAGVRVWSFPCILVSKRNPKDRRDLHASLSGTNKVMGFDPSDNKLKKSVLEEGSACTLLAMAVNDERPTVSRADSKS